MKYFQIISVLVILLFWVIGLHSQPLEPGQWRNYTAMNSVNDVVVDGVKRVAWVATEGGIYRVSYSSFDRSTIFSFRNSDGLNDNDITALALDGSNLFVGSNNGGLDLINGISGTITNITDIAQASQFPFKKIMKLTISDSILYIATGFGLSIYNIPGKYILETIPRFGALNNQDTVFDVAIANDSIYAVLSGAIAIAAKNSPSIQAPFAWKIIRSNKNTYLHSIAAFKSQIIIGSPQGLFVRTGDSITPIALNVDDSISILKLSVIGDTLFILDNTMGGRIVKTSDLLHFDFEPIAAIASTVTSFALTPSHFRIVASATAGISAETSNGTITNFVPDGPLSNDVSDITFAQRERVAYACYDKGFTGFQPSNSMWVLYPGIGSRYVFYDSLRSTLWGSNFGQGLIAMTFSPTLSITKYGIADGLVGFNNNDPFTVMGKGSLDNAGAFIVSQYAFNGKGFAKLNPDGKSFTSVQLATNGEQKLAYASVVQDLDDIYFVATEDVSLPPTFGVFAYTPAGETIPIGAGSGQLLPVPGVNDLLVDQDNGLWCGTSVGVTVLSHSRDFQTGKTVFHSRNVPFLDQQIVNSISVDGIGNKWVSTNDGVFVVSADGTDSLAHFTPSNSPLLSSRVTGVAIDFSTGEAYISTNKGISRTSTIFKQGRDDYSTIMVYPNPIIQQGEDPVSMTIDGLVAGSTVKVYTSAGRLVASIDASALGGSVRWNCRDDNNKILPSGVYVLSANAENAKESGQTKFVLVRK